MNDYHRYKGPIIFGIVGALIMALGVFSLLDAPDVCSVISIDRIDLDGPIIIASSALVILLYALRRERDIVYGAILGTILSLFVFLRVYFVIKDYTTVRSNASQADEWQSFSNVASHNLEIQLGSFVLILGAVLSIAAAIMVFIKKRKGTGDSDEMVGGGGIYD